MSQVVICDYNYAGPRSFGIVILVYTAACPHKVIVAPGTLYPDHGILTDPDMHMFTLVSLLQQLGFSPLHQPKAPS